MGSDRNHQVQLCADFPPGLRDVEARSGSATLELV